MKGDCRRRDLKLPRAVDDLADDLLMAAMEAVEVADGRDTADGEVRLSEGVVKNEHSVKRRRILT